MDMKLSDFLKLNNPIEYNFEFENKLLAESGLDTYSRYFTYKANNDKARKDVYKRQLSQTVPPPVAKSSMEQAS